MSVRGAVFFAVAAVSIILTIAPSLRSALIQSGRSATDQSPTISNDFLDAEAKSDRHMKKLASLLRKSARAQDELDTKVSFPVVLDTVMMSSRMCIGTKTLYFQSIRYSHPPRLREVCR